MPSELHGDLSLRELAWPKGEKMTRQWTAYLSNLSFVKMERPGQRSARMTEFRSPAVALSINQTFALISTSENDRGQTDNGNES